METHWLEFISRHQTDGIIHKYVIRLSKLKKKRGAMLYLNNKGNMALFKIILGIISTKLSLQVNLQEPVGFIKWIKILKQMQILSHNIDKKGISLLITINLLLCKLHL